MRLFGNRKANKKGGRWAFWRWYDVILDDELYLTRLTLLKTPWFSVKLHWIHRPDPDRDLHDHPWAFAGIVLRGGYKELHANNPHTGPVVERTINWFNHKNTISSHRIIEVKPNTLTLIFATAKKKDWGFYDEETFAYTKWQDYV